MSRGFFFRGSFCISSTIGLQLSRKRMPNVPWKRCMRNVFWWKPRNAMTFMMKPRCFLFHVFFFASWGFWQVFPKEVGLKQPTPPVFSPWDTWTSRAGSNSGTTCCPPKTWHATCATTGTEPGRWPLQKVKQLEWVWMLPKSNCQHVGRHCVWNLLCDSDFCVVFFKSYHHGQKEDLPTKNVSTKSSLWMMVVVFFSWDLSQVPITAGAPIIASGPVEPESLSKEVGGRNLKTFFFGAALAGSTKRFLRLCVRCLEKNFCWCFLIGFFLCWFFSPNDPLFWLDKTLFWRVFSPQNRGTFTGSRYVHMVCHCHWRGFSESHQGGPWAQGGSCDQNPRFFGNDAMKSYPVVWGLW